MVTVTLQVECDGRAYHALVETDNGTARNRTTLHSTDPITIYGEGLNTEVVCEPRGPHQHTSVEVTIEAVAMSTLPEQNTVTLHGASAEVTVVVSTAAMFWRVAAALRTVLPPRTAVAI